MEKTSNKQEWQGQFELGPAVNEIEIFDFLDFGGKYSKKEIQESGASEDDSKKGIINTSHNIYTQIQDVQKEVNKRYQKLKKNQKRELTTLLVAAKEGNLKLWRIKNAGIEEVEDSRESRRIESLFEFIEHKPSASELETERLYLQEGVFNLVTEYIDVKNRKSLDPILAEATLLFKSDIDNVKSTDKSVTEAHRKIAEFLAKGGNISEVKKYIERVKLFRTKLSGHNFRLEKDLFSALSAYPQDEEYRKLLNQCNEIFCLNPFELIFFFNTLATKSKSISLN